MTTGSELGALRAALERHHARDGQGVVCAECSQWWPCDAARALEALDAMEDGSAYQLAIEQVRYEEERRHAAEAQVAALVEALRAIHGAAAPYIAEDMFGVYPLGLFTVIADTGSVLSGLSAAAAANNALIAREAAAAERERLLALVRQLRDAYSAPALKNAMLAVLAPLSEEAER